MLEAALIENIEREELNVIEVAHAMRLMRDRFGISQDDIAHKLCKNPSTVSNTLRLLTLPDDIQKMILSNKIEFGHAKVILSLNSEIFQRELAGRIIENGWSVRRTEEEARKMSTTSNGTKKRKCHSDDNISLEHEFTKYLGTSVTIHLRRKNEMYIGTVQIKVTSKTDIDRILSILRKGSIENQLTDN